MEIIIACLVFTFAIALVYFSGGLLNSEKSTKTDGENKSSVFNLTQLGQVKTYELIIKHLEEGVLIMDSNLHVSRPANALGEALISDPELFRTAYVDAVDEAVLHSLFAAKSDALSNTLIERLPTELTLLNHDLMIKNVHDMQNNKLIILFRVLSIPKVTKVEDAADEDDFESDHNIVLDKVEEYLRKIFDEASHNTNQVSEYKRFVVNGVRSVINRIRDLNLERTSMNLQDFIDEIDNYPGEANLSKLKLMVMNTDIKSFTKDDRDEALYIMERAQMEDNVTVTFKQFKYMESEFNKICSHCEGGPELRRRLYEQMCLIKQEKVKRMIDEYVDAFQNNVPEFNRKIQPIQFEFEEISGCIETIASHVQMVLPLIDSSMIRSIETPVERFRRDKPESGLIKFKMGNYNGMRRITIFNDGKGFSEEESLLLSGGTMVYTEDGYGGELFGDKKLNPINVYKCIQKVRECGGKITFSIVPTMSETFDVYIPLKEEASYEG